MRRLALLCVAVLVALPAVAAAKSNDSLAPPDAPPHWLPPEPWVYNHWIPYDEGRLYALLHVTREQLWQQLRDDHRNVAELARRHGWRDPQSLAAALVAPWRGRVGSERLSVLRGRALRTITQGHLAQHLFFHSLHQFAIPSAAPRIFGISDTAFRDIRRTLELSPLTIARLHGRSPARVEEMSVAVLRDRVRAGVAGHAMTARQGRILLARQITQLPRWLGQARYNGPPKTHRGQLVGLPHDYATNPSVSADGTHVVFEQYRQKLPVALRLGEIAVVSRDLRSGRSALVSKPAAPRADEPLDPRSAYNATVSGDGRLVGYESSPGNVNFAKRYGRIAVELTDLARGRTTRIDRPLRGSDLSQSAYNPQLAADGRHLAFQAVRAGTAQVFVCDLHTGSRSLASTGLPRAPRGTTTSIYEPGMSADGRFVAFTAVTSRTDGRPGATTSRVMLRDLRAKVTTPISDGTPGFASEPSVSGDGRLVAFTAGARVPRLYLRDVAAGTTKALTDAGAGAVVDPQLSTDGSTLAYTLVRAGHSRVEVRGLRDAAVQTVASTRGSVTDPSLSANGAVLAFTSDAPDVSADKADRTRGVFVRDLRSGATTLVSPPTARAAASAPPVPVARSPATRRPVSGGSLRAPVVSIVDNAFVRGREEPRLPVRAGTVVTWRWRSQSSHNVSARSGPERFRASTRSHGVFRRRFAQTGVYRIVCTLHSPGMHMTVVVR